MSNSSILLAQVPVPARLQPNKAFFVDEGGFRVFSPQVTLERYSHLINAQTGVIRSVSPLSVPEHDPLFVYVARFSPPGALHAVSTSIGKGKSAVQSKVSALSEAVERASSAFHGNEPYISDSYNNLGPIAIDPNHSMLYSEAQYESTTSGHYSRSPLAFDPESVISWTPLWSLTDHTYKLIPSAHCYFHYVGPGGQFCYADSNGNAAGNVIEEAILQGIMELVERDAVAIWWYNRLQRPQVDILSFDDPYIKSLNQFYSAVNRTLWVLDITSDLGIPTFAALSANYADKNEPILYGFGTHFNAHIALNRALTEMNQGLPIILNRRRKSKQWPPTSNPKSMKEWPSSMLSSELYLTPNANLPIKRFSDYEAYTHIDLLTDINLCIDIFNERGLELLYLDQTRASIGMPVVKVFVPGLRPHWQRFAPGRLYDVPVSLNWQAAPLPEHALNPYPINK